MNRRVNVKVKAKWDGQAGAAANAQSELPKLADAYFAEVRAALAARPRPAALHALRVSGKKLRYSLELFRPCYGPGLEERIDALKQVQDLLGQVNDSVVALAVLQRVMRPSRLRTRVERFAAARTAAKVKAFRLHWQQVFDAPGRQEWWTGYLSLEAHPPAA
jgi:CHAD domain-containing protein